MQGRIRGLDGLRALAAMGVVAHHYTYRDTGLGNLSVQMFLVLSGFLLVGILHEGRAKVDAGLVGVPAALAGFWRNRAVRILPAFYVVLALATAHEVHKGSPSLLNGMGGTCCSSRTSTSGSCSRSGSP